MDSKKVQLYLDREKTIEASPVTGANCVILSDGNDLQKVLNNDLTTPTVVHEETSFKVGVGDINVSSGVVDGEVGHMVIKGKTYQNILPEPSTHVLTNNKEMFKVNEGLDPNVEIVDGVSKSAILSGKTLVNIPTTYNRKPLIGNIMIETTNLSMLKSNTKYLLKIINKSNYNITYYPNASSFTGNDFTVNGKSEGYVILTSLDTTLTHNGIVRLRSSNETITDLECAILFIEYQDGMENWDLPYFEGMQSVKLPVLHTIGKNLLSGYINGGINANTGEDASASDKIRTSFIAIDNAKSYYLSNIPSQSWNYVAYYDSNKQFIGRTGAGAYTSRSLSSSNGQVGDSGYRGDIFPYNAKYIKLTSYQNVNTGDVTAEELLEMSKSTQLEEGSAATSYEPYKTNILSTSEDVELRGIGDVRDELDLLTGEVTEHIGEITLDGSETWTEWAISETSYGFALRDAVRNFKPYTIPICNTLLGYDYNSFPLKDKGIALYTVNTSSYSFFIRLPKNECNGINDFKSWLLQNPITVQYELATESIKTVDLSTSGNWEKIVYNGASNESWSYRQEYDTTNTYCFKNNKTITNGLLFNSTCLAFSDTLPINGLNVDKHSIHINGQPNVLIKIDKKLITEPTVEQLQLYLSSNPVTIWYQTQTQQDSTQVKQPIFFKDGLIQLSSGADNSLIPTLDYQAKTSNSYVMDLMKANTIYTMKNDLANGKFTIDGTQYNLVTNGKLKTPTTLTDKLLVINGSASNTMILEGDLTSKTIPYFKGIKSAFEGESKIEVLSTGKNLFDDYYKFIDVRESRNYYITSEDTDGATRILFSLYDKDKKLIKNNKAQLINQFYYRENDSKWMLGSNNIKLNSRVVFSDESVSYIKFETLDGLYKEYDNIQFESGNIATSYEPYKSNSTKIPLLSPLRSLQNGVCDELIIDRMKKKATLIKRLDCITFDGSSDENWHSWGINNSVTHLNSYHYVDGTNNTKNLKVKANPSWFTSRLGYGGGYASNKTGASLNNSYFAFSIPKNLIGAGGGDTTTMCEKNARKWLSQNPVTVYYELATPVVTEIDLESFPLVYKDGHIFLNSEIAPVVEIAYNVNQAQQIQANNETLQRHELDILDLDNLIVSFVNAEYNLRLLKFDMELSMMALAE